MAMKKIKFQISNALSMYQGLSHDLEIGNRKMLGRPVFPREITIYS